MSLVVKGDGQLSRLEEFVIESINVSGNLILRLKTSDGKIVDQRVFNLLSKSFTEIVSIEAVEYLYPVRNGVPDRDGGDGGLNRRRGETGRVIVIRAKNGAYFFEVQSAGELVFYYSARHAYVKSVPDLTGFA